MGLLVIMQCVWCVLSPESSSLSVDRQTRKTDPSHQNIDDAFLTTGCQIAANEASNIRTSESTVVHRQPAMKLGLYSGFKMASPAIAHVARMAVPKTIQSTLGLTTGGAATTTSCIPSVVAQMAPTLSALAIRGGNAALQNFDLERTRIRLESINSYGVVTALLLQAALRLYSSTPKDLGESRIQNATKIVFILSVGLSIICGAYTTVVFSLLGLYSKSALGLNMDSSFLEFFAATATVRKRAFDSFLIALISFELCFVTSLFLNYDGKVRWWVASVAIILAFYSWQHWQDIITVAGRLLFRK